MLALEIRNITALRLGGPIFGLKRAIDECVVVGPFPSPLARSKKSPWPAPSGFLNAPERAHGQLISRHLLDGAHQRLSLMFLAIIADTLAVVAKASDVERFHIALSVPEAAHPGANR